MDDPTRFANFMDVWERCLKLIRHDPTHIFNADEVGIQLADHEVRLFTGKQYLNKVVASTSLHCTLTLCTSASGEVMTPHFLFPDKSEKNKEGEENGEEKGRRERGGEGEANEEGESKEEGGEEGGKEGEGEGGRKRRKGGEGEEEKKLRKKEERILQEGPKNMLAGLGIASDGKEEAYFVWNGSGYQEAESWFGWMEKFCLWSEGIKRQKDKPAILLVDGHESHVSVPSIFLAARNRVVVVCLPSHTTSVLQPNDRAVNRRLKLNIQEHLEKHVCADVIITDADVAWLTVQALRCEEKGKTLKEATKSSWKATGCYPYDSRKVMDEVKKYQAKKLSKKERAKLEKMGGVIEEMGKKKEGLRLKKQKRKEEYDTIPFGTKQVRILTSAESLARLSLHKEWVKVKRMNRGELVQRVKEVGCWEGEIDTPGKKKPTVLLLRKCLRGFYLEREKELTAKFEGELKQYQSEIPLSLNHFWTSPAPPPPPKPPLPVFYAFLFEKDLPFHLQPEQLEDESYPIHPPPPPAPPNPLSLLVPPSSSPHFLLPISQDLDEDEMMENVGEN